MAITRGEKNLICVGKQNMMQMCSCHFQHSLRAGELRIVFEGILLKDAPIKARVLRASAEMEEPHSTTNLAPLITDVAHDLQSRVASEE